MENFRCFRERQDVRLAPLTLLVGENSTGKTSFLALIRALADAGYGRFVPDFNQRPYDLGSYDDIAFNTSGNATVASEFRSGFNVSAPDQGWVAFEFTFRKRGPAAFPARRMYWNEYAAIEQIAGDGRDYEVVVSTQRGKWNLRLPEEFRNDLVAAQASLWIIQSSLYGNADGANGIPYVNFIPQLGTPHMGNDEARAVGSLLDALVLPQRSQPFAGAPIRSKPRRTYEHASVTHDPEGALVPAYLADSFAHPEVWANLQRDLEKFGSRSGLFDEIQIRPFGGESDPFQVQVRKNGVLGRGHWRNLIDVGFGVSQALPVIAELVRPLAFEMFLLQQPEVHLHPAAQAALGSFFCDIAGSTGPQRRLIVETHSDHLINRVRMDVRDGTTGLRPEDVVVLYFERNDLEVTIHEVAFDELGNVVGAPPSYGRFFMEEIHRSLWKREVA